MPQKILFGFMGLALLCSCGGEGGGEEGEGEPLEQEGVGEGEAEAEAEQEQEQEEEEKEPAEGLCPELANGLNAGLVVAGTEREFILRAPDGYDGSAVPLVFGFHPLGGNAAVVVALSGMDQMSESEGFILVAPESRRLNTEWDLFQANPDNNLDVLMFDRILECVGEQYSIDPDRVYATGFSAGGLFTTYLSLHRSEVLAATAPVSGGVNQTSWSTPAEQRPTLVVWGGPDDVAVVSFDVFANILIDNLLEAGHFVVGCDHGQGHWWPVETGAYVWEFFRAHPRGVTPEPYLGGLPDIFPSYCSIR